MSSSCRNGGLLAALALAVPVLCGAAQDYFIPEVSLTAEEHSNRELLGNSAAQTSQVYLASLAADLGRASPRSNTRIRPRVVFQSLPKRDGSDRLEEFLDLLSTYATLRGNYAFTAQFARQDVVNAELTGAAFGEPGSGAIGSGIVQVRGTRSYYDAEPSFDYQLNNRMYVSGGLRYLAVKYDTDLSALRVGFESPYAQVLVGRSWQRTHLGLGPYYTRYTADDDSNITDTWGAILQMDHEWSEVSQLNLALRAERDDSRQLSPVAVETKNTAFGVEMEGVRRTVAGSMRYSIGRFLEPSTLGQRRQQDQVRLQYTRAFTQRTSLTGALRLSRDRIAGETSSASNRDRAAADISFNHALTEVLILSAGYRFLWQDIQFLGDRAHDQTVFASLIYRGRKPQGMKETP